MKKAGRCSRTPLSLSAGLTVVVPGSWLLAAVVQGVRAGRTGVVGVGALVALVLAAEPGCLRACVSGPSRAPSCASASLRLVHVGLVALVVLVLLPLARRVDILLLAV